MSIVFMSHRHLLESEERCAIEFDVAYPNLADLISEWLDTALRMPYYAGNPLDSEGVHFFTAERFHRLPYSVRAIWLVVRGGYYAESGVFIRTILETFVQWRYFNRHPQLLAPHFSSNNQKQRIDFKRMFDEFSPGYYDAHYRVLCSIAHSGAGLSAMSGMEHIPDGSGRILAPIGCRFDREMSSYIINHTMTLLAGYLACVPDWFPDYFALVDEETEQRRLDALQYFKDWRQGMRSSQDPWNLWNSLEPLISEDHFPTRELREEQQQERHAEGANGTEGGDGEPG